MENKTLFSTVDRNAEAVPVMFIPLTRAVFCIDCEAILPGGCNRCAACGSASLVTLEPWLVSLRRVRASVEVARCR